MLGKLKKWLSPDSDNPFPNDFTNKILKHSKELGWNIGISSETNVVLNFEMDEGRSQIVSVFLAGEIAGQKVIQISSPAAKLEDIADKLDQDFYNNLLNLNAQASNYGWAIETIEGEGDYLIAASDQLLSTFDVGEFKYAVAAVANSADTMEAEFGLDKF